MNLTEGKYKEYDIEALAAEMNKLYFNNELKFDFPMGYFNSRRVFGHVVAMVYWADRRKTRANKIEIDRLEMSSNYNMNEKLFKEILVHELIHVKAFQTDRPSEGHGYWFDSERNRIKKLGMDVPIGEDVPKDIQMDLGNELKKEIYGFIKDESIIGMYREQLSQEELIKLLSRYYYSTYRSGKPAKLEFFKTKDTIVRKYPISKGGKFSGSAYGLLPGDYELFKPYIYYTENVTTDSWNDLLNSRKEYDNVDNAQQVRQTA